MSNDFGKFYGEIKLATFYMVGCFLKKEAIEGNATDECISSPPEAPITDLLPIVR